MVAQSGARLKASDPVASVQYDDGLVQDFPLARLRLADFSGSVPWRRVRSRHGQAHYSGSFVSATMSGFVVYESRLELARLLLADFDPQVQRIYAQPFRLVAGAGGRVRHHVPDFLLVTAAGTARLVNVKPAQRLKDPEIAWSRSVFAVSAGRHAPPRLLHQRGHGQLPQPAPGEPGRSPHERGGPRLRRPPCRDGRPPPLPPP
jgi:hypothetical protein